ncbi:hypothetical protein [Hyphococcus sp.]|uniref:hypothetical protein n=1 Tax=Hyphococcus sp. TaxID=2038636 RepID=UPI003CCB78CE
MKKIIAIAGLAALAAACGDSDSDVTADDRTAAGRADEAPERANTNATASERNVARSVATVPGEWHYKETDGYPWAGFGPPASEAVFAISCQNGQIIFTHAGPLNGDNGEMTMEIDGSPTNIEVVDRGQGLPMVEGAAAPNGLFVDALMQTESAFTVRMQGKSMELPPDAKYRRVIRACRDGVT